MAERARGAYIAAAGRPDLPFGFAYASQILTPDEVSIRALNLQIQKAKRNPVSALRFVPLDNKSITLTVFADASFAYNPGMSFQLGFVIALADKFGNTNVVHCSSAKSKQVTQSVLAAELFAAIHAFYFASTLRVTLRDIFHRVIRLVLHTDSKSLFNSTAGLTSATEKRVLIDLFILRQSYELRELTKIVWNPSEQNSADAITKINASNDLSSLL